MATITGRVIRKSGKDISTDELSTNYRGVKYVPYRIEVAGAASVLRGIILVAKPEIEAYGDPDGEAITLTLT